MSLADLVNNNLKDFDPKKDNINGGGNGLPAGDYKVSISEAGHTVYKSGYDCLKFKFEVIEGEHTGESELMNVSFAETSKKGNPIPDFVLERNMKTILTLSELMDAGVTSDMFLLGNETDIHVAIDKKIHDKVGVVVNMNISERPNKKDPSNPYKEYEFSEAKQPENIDIDDEDLPF
ncbi:DUF669 domain-containing protein [Apilactobacillus micheneri]|uniref:DUF669 domain-containing protein n=1 Tax=Apilactobacillus micheneri TaxID=1899430 RepID=UPI0011289E5E|nr:DUF669 domain-containing protein [Apilactobacillus micheneri]TPR40429.1 hypothetical protein DY119_01695 [Apilactobacillus micheneri]